MGRRPRGDWRRVNHSDHGGGTEGPPLLSEAASNGYPKGSHLEGAAPSAPVPRRGQHSVGGGVDDPAEIGVA